MTEATITEVKEARKKLDVMILSRLQAFEAAYKVRVVNIHITRQVTMSEEDNLQKVEVEVIIGR